jgi:hypothetical protein
MAALHFRAAGAKVRVHFAPLTATGTYAKLLIHIRPAVFDFT